MANDRDNVLERIVSVKREAVARRKVASNIPGLHRRLMPSDRSLADALRRDGLRFILEAKKRSPSRGDLRPDLTSEEIAYAYRDVADAISVVTDEPFFGGRLEFLTEVRDRVDVPVLLKDFVVDPFQVVEARAHGADAVLLMMSVLTDDGLFSDCLGLAAELGLDALVEVHDDPELERALGLGAQIIGINNRNLKTLEIDLETTDRLSGRVPEDRVVVSESGISSRADLERVGPNVHAVLVGTHLMKRPDLRGAARELVFGAVKICGLTSSDAARAAERAGARCGGLIFADTSPRYVDPETARAVRDAAALDWVGVFVDEAPERVSSLAKDLRLHAVQLHGRENDEYIRSLRAQLPESCEVWKALTVEEQHRELPQGVDRVLFDSGWGRQRGGTGQAFDWARLEGDPRLGRGVLAGGLNVDNIRDASAVGASMLDVSSGVESSPGNKSEPMIRRLFSELRPDDVSRRRRRARAGYFGELGGMFVPEILVPALEALEEGFEEARSDPAFVAELNGLLAEFAGRPTPLYECQNLDLGSVRLFLKREDLLHGGAHKTNQVLAQGLLARRMGKTRLLAETGAGQHGVATAMAGALLGLETRVYMGSKDVERQAPNVQRMKLLGAEVVPVDSGSASLKDAINDALRDWAGTYEESHYLLGSVAGPHPYPTMVREFQRVIGREARAQIVARIGRLPDAVVACVGGGSNAMGMFADFVPDPVRLIGVEAGGHGIDSNAHGATLEKGRIGILHGAKTLLLQDDSGLVQETDSVSAGLDYPGVGPEHAYLLETGRAEYVAATDDEALDAFETLTRREGILPALESAHAVAHALRLARSGGVEVILVNLSGRGDKDLANVERALAARREGLSR